MNRSAVSLVLVVVLSLMILGCQPAVVNTNSNAPATASPPKETFDRAAIETEIKQLARDWISTSQNYDPEIIQRVIADDAVLVYPDGVLATKTDELRLVESKAITVDSFEIPEANVTVLNADSAFITGRSVIKNGRIKDVNMPRPVDISGEYRYLDVYARRNGRWQVIASQATKVTAPAPAVTPSASAQASPSPSPTASGTASP